MSVHREEDADLAGLTGCTVSVHGYGNQGRAQPLDLCDTGIAVIVSGIEDEHARQARDVSGDGES